METEQRIFDPRAGLWLLIAANMIAFRPHAFWLELALIGLLLALMLGHGRLTMAFKWTVGYCALVVFQQFILPVSPMIIAPRFTIFTTSTLLTSPDPLPRALFPPSTLPRSLRSYVLRATTPPPPTLSLSIPVRFYR